MKKHFYSHIVETSSISLALGEMELTPDERKHLISLAEDNLHHAILDAVLSELSDEDKEKFLILLANDEHEKVWDLLTKRVDHIEDKIRQAAEDLKKELHKDMEESHKR